MPVDLKQSHFELFALPVQYALERSLLDQRYRALQRSVHPDRFASASDQERRISMQQAAQINEAYQVLKDPLRRGRYLLELRGQRVDDADGTATDPEFLMAQMELREALAEVRVASDPLQALEQIAAQVREQAQALENELGRALDSGADADLAGALDTVRKMQFYVRLTNEMTELEADLEDELY